MTDEATTWNNSKLWTIEQCAERARRIYFEPEPFSPTTVQLRGTVVHEMAAEAHRRQLRGDALPGREETSDLAATAWRERVDAQGITLNDDERKDQTGTLDHAMDVVVDLSRLYVGVVAPRIVPVAVERKITLKPKDSDVVIHGTMDLVALEQVPEGFEQHPRREIIRDQKTKESAPLKTSARDSQQLTFYHMLRTAENEANGKPAPVGVVLDYLVRTPGRGELSHKPLWSTRDAADVHALVERINTAVDAVKKGVFMPTTPDDPLCSPKWCPFFRSCRYVTDRKERG